MSATEAPPSDLERINAPFRELSIDGRRERLRWDTPAFAANCLLIEDDNSNDVLLRPKPEQLRFDEALEAQRASGEPMRAIILKARKLGFSTWVQAKLIQRVTQGRNHKALVLGQDRTTAGVLFDIGQKMWANIPDEADLRPKPKYNRRQNYLELHNGSIYRADGAKEYDAGRGLTLHSLHLSEVAFYDDAERKLRGLINAVPKTHPNTMIVLESTANGQGYFKDLWDTAVLGESDYLPFFSPWFHDPYYRRRFPNEAERDEFIESLGEGTVGEDEQDLLDMGVDLEQLHWRRWVIRGVDFNGDVEKFHVEYPATPEEAFMSTGRHVFTVRDVRRMQQRVREVPGPDLGRLETVGKPKTYDSRGITVHRPLAVEFIPGRVNDDRQPGWRIWEHPAKKTEDTPEGQYILGVDASGGEQKEGTTAYHVISICDHRTRVQVAEYRSKIDPDELGLEIYKACLYWNRPWVAIEVTGSWGLPAAKRVHTDFQYPFVYKRKRQDSSKEKIEDTLGWHTGFGEKKLLIAELKEMLRNEVDGTKSRGLADEYGWYIQDDRNRMKPEYSRTADRLIARGISVVVAREKPLRPDRPRGQVTSTIAGSELSKSGWF